MKGLTGILKSRGERWVWIGQRGHDAAGLKNIIDLCLIVSCDSGRESSLFFKEKDIISLESRLEIRRDWSNEHLSESLSGEEGREFFSRISGSKGVNLVCYRSLRVLENKADEKGFRVLAAPVRLKKKFDNKIFFHKALPGLGIDSIKGFIARPGAYEFNELECEFGGPFVLQRAFSSSGLNTFLIKDSSQYRSLTERFSSEEVLLRRFTGGYSVNINAVIYDSDEAVEVALSCPSVQITGAAACSNFASSYCGNDYASASGIPDRNIKKIGSITRKVGLWMARSGYRGLFGMDYIVSPEGVYPVEINPRLQNSTSLLTTLESIEYPQDDPLLALHLAQFFAGGDSRTEEQISSMDPESFLRPVTGSQVILHNPLQKSVVGKDFEPGIYFMEGERLKLLSHAASMTPDMPEGSFLVSCGVPQKGYLVEPNAPLCKIESKSGAVANGLKQLSEEMIKRIRSVYGALELRAVEGSRVELRSHAEAGCNKIEALK